MDAHGSPGSLFADQRMRSLTGLASIGRLQDSMTILALLLGAHAAGLGLAKASLCSAVLLFATGASLAVKARWMDRSGMRGPIGLLSVLTLCSYAVLIFALHLHLFALVVAAAALLGATRTNPGMCMQVTWMQVLSDKNLRARAVSWENLVNTLMQSLGPILVGALVAVWSPILALVFCGLATSLSMFLWSRSSVHIPLFPKHCAPTKPGVGIGSRVWVLASLALFSSLLMGALQVVLVGSQSVASAAFFNATLAFGAGAASLYSVLRGFPLLRHLSAAAVLGILGLTTLLPLAGVLPVFFLLPALVSVGALFALGNSAGILLIQGYAPEGRRSETLSWRLTSTFVGLSVGQALCGQFIGLIGISGAATVFSGLGLLLLSCALLAMGLVKLTVIRRARPALA